MPCNQARPRRRVPVNSTPWATAIVSPSCGLLASQSRANTNPSLALESDPYGARHTSRGIISVGIKNHLSGYLSAYGKAGSDSTRVDAPIMVESHFFSERILPTPARLTVQ